MSSEAALDFAPGVGADIGADAILNALESVVIVVAPDRTIQFINDAGEEFFAASASQIRGHDIAQFIPVDSPLISLLAQAMNDGNSVFETGLTIATPRIQRQVINVQVSPLDDHPGSAVINIFGRSIADQVDRQMTHRNAARSVTAMAAMLAHEVKNPLSGIRGAAQLLEQAADADDQKLTRLICDETDRICALVDRMEVFSDQRVLDTVPVNIHLVLERVKALAKAGFAQDLNILELYDPSLPPVEGNHDQLVQIFLNLVKNAAEAAPASNGEIQLTTQYRHGVRYAVQGSRAQLHLPLVVTIQDNGPGIPANLQNELFDAFVTTKPKGSGLGLALVAKMVDDHGGVIEFDSQPGRTEFRVMLPVAEETS
ncbi:MAG: PAS domain-containing protein [Rhodospirillaceae bacterium]|jgi:two-component system nitrogen regulation sensor histidine kinase GlnL|nr:PAS domain-containing protein [Rhodospirillaceae bacterium]MBT3883312.1 PAS domain-containing protein [Rhodospirillaceae bacterium]MBT4115406.1 PAS domain-containing protein [Rhodospirillaceae bacterium]MBT4671047.1 PAS domain-containing protein [Rhodospirillaceae bacterium]MBT4750730.1 PAS domain-containing protein [Rhodospirillaceae bacterium]